MPSLKEAPVEGYHFEFSASYQIQLVHSRGEQWIRLKGNFGENQDIKVEATMFDGSIPVSKAGGPGQDVKLHISLVIISTRVMVRCWSSCALPAQIA
ncbi:hypothetical protein EZV62_025983 [Acer yangbiense]|uniref:Uncharacterized protein n=1 Tax=Acer yangbiense TaxID=1000413 RepID=A0A5C7GNA9_9ROSI|nr:hypothetical protein EZV62_028211 [Acer yangbiense]TXG50108.1 hypothetical protein EZV62_025983 [Acer yangbiense]